MFNIVKGVAGFIGFHSLVGQLVAYAPLSILYNLTSTKQGSFVFNLHLRIMQQLSNSPHWQEPCDELLTLLEKRLETERIIYTGKACLYAYSAYSLYTESDNPLAYLSAGYACYETIDEINRAFNRPQP